ncbi:MAG TPA: 5-(carboxyamino)imidazole ribonucleotide synthase [Oligoflexia bacterium]|nr:5-(carboxyamino)imidazole ribonucleotide synthase [Oligoflexia bacterium]HMP48836.1 5-(carboxyamino)imidazole ribonucleotide synthase [Oligoflexia bacterium]
MNTISKNPVVGILGGGQLARMMAIAATNLGIGVKIVDSESDVPARVFSGFKRISFEDIEKIQSYFSDINLLTYEFENIPLSTLTALSSKFPIYPDIRALEISRNRILEKSFASTLNIPVPKWLSADSIEELLKRQDELFFPSILKTASGGYDGKGQWRPETLKELEQISITTSNSSFPVILEELVNFTKEYSCIGVRTFDGEVHFYSICENTHKNGILVETVSPPRSLSKEKQFEMEKYTSNLLNALSYVGVIAVEFFFANDNIFFNEFAPRVHNSGHWTIEGAETSQFENHIRACLRLPIGSTRNIGYSLMNNLLGAESFDVNLARENILKEKGVHLHWYGKENIQPKRKVGHITIVSENEEFRDDSKNKLANFKI